MHADVRFKDRPPVERHTWIEAPFNADHAVWQHRMTDSVWRMNYQMAPNTGTEQVSREETVRQRLNAQFGRIFGPDEERSSGWAPMPCAVSVSTPGATGGYFLRVTQRM